MADPHHVQRFLAAQSPVIDAHELRSSMTPVAEVADDDQDFTAVLARYSDDLPDPATLARH